jgi:hypothetical protein
VTTYYSRVRFTCWRNFAEILTGDRSLPAFRKPDKRASVIYHNFTIGIYAGHWAVSSIGQPISAQRKHAA